MTDVLSFFNLVNIMCLKFASLEGNEIIFFI